MKTKFPFAALYVVGMMLICGLLAWGRPFPLVGLFVVSGLAVGSLYALGGVGLVVLYRTTGVLNYAIGAFGAAAPGCHGRENSRGRSSRSGAASRS